MCPKHVFASLFYVNDRNTASQQTRYMNTPIVDLRLGQHWTNIERTLGECLVFAGLLVG